MSLLQGVTNLQGALPPPDTRRVITREAMRRCLLDRGVFVRAGATRDEMIPIFERENISMNEVGAAGPRPVEYRAAPAPEAPPRGTAYIDVEGRSAQQLKAICKEIDPLFRPPTKANRFVYLAFLYARGRVPPEVFAGLE